MRLVLATLFIGHGAQKVFGAFGGIGIDGFASWSGPAASRSTPPGC